MNFFRGLLNAAMITAGLMMYAVLIFLILFVLSRAASAACVQYPEVGGQLYWQCETGDIASPIAGSNAQLVRQQCLEYATETGRTLIIKHYWLEVCNPPREAIATFSPPTTNEDGTPLTDLGELRIYFAANMELLHTEPQPLIPQPNFEFTVVLDRRGCFLFSAVDINGNESNKVGACTPEHEGTGFLTFGNRERFAVR